MATGFFIVPRNVLGGNGFISPSDQLNIGAIGIGGRGQDIMGSWAKNERVIALCDVDPDNSVMVLQNLENITLRPAFTRISERCLTEKKIWMQ